MTPICAQDIVVGHNANRPKTQKSISISGKSCFYPTWADFRGSWLPLFPSGGFVFLSRKIVVENTTFNLICYQVHNDSWKYTYYHYKSHSWKQPSLYILLISIQNEQIDTLWNIWYRYQTRRFCVERFIFFWLIYIFWWQHLELLGEKEKSFASKILLWKKV